MGCGKSSVGRRLSELLCCRFMDLDDVVEEVAGRSIPEIFAKDGELGFRQRELKALKDTLCDSGRGKEIPMTPVCASRIHPLAGGGMSSPSHSTPASPANESNTSSERNTAHNASGCVPATISAVLALGGGTVMTPECAEMVRENTCCIYLRASVDTLLERLSSNTSNRPLLTRDPHAALQGAQRRGNPSLHSRIDELMSQRSSTYDKTAHTIIDIDGKSIEQICSEILC
jgi:shikimate kinase